MSADSFILNFVKPPGIDLHSGGFESRMNLLIGPPIQDMDAYSSAMLGESHRLPVGLDMGLNWRSKTDRRPEGSICKDKRRLQIAEGQDKTGALRSIFVEQRERQHVRAPAAQVLTIAGESEQGYVVGSQYVRDPDTGLWRIDCTALAVDPETDLKAEFTSSIVYPMNAEAFEQVPFTVRLMYSLLVRSGRISTRGDILWSNSFGPSIDSDISVTAGNEDIVYPALLNKPQN
ncbi:MAG: hypothetical protein NUV65_02670 [Candidatus Roizmanbacteria bacterium]|nr:hypothetical protein [Candidatus Roizmanbacteria bacterium]